MQKLWQQVLVFLAAVLASSPAASGLAEAVTLDQLVGESRQVVVGSVLNSYSVREVLGNRSRIVTYSRVRVEEHVAGTTTDSEVMVRTLGGRVGDVAEIVHGAARLDRKEPNLLFLRERAPHVFSITAETQGVFPLRRSPKGEMRLNSSRDLAKLLGKLNQSAMSQLRGRTMHEATELIRATERRLLSPIQR